MQEVLAKKVEFRQLTAAEVAAEVGVMRPRAHQLYLARYVAPPMPARYTFVSYETGTGKTLAAILAAMPYAQTFREQYAALVRDAVRAGTPVRAARLHAAQNTPNTNVIGFTGAIFREELARYPALGVVSVEELEEYKRLLARLQNAAARDAGAAETEELRVAARNMAAGFKRRMINKIQGGFWRFTGYQELVLQMFPQLGETDLQALSAQADAQGVRVSDKITEAETAGRLRVNWQFVRSFRGSFCVFDEVHHAYNSRQPNNWGVAIRFLLEQTSAEPAMRAVFMTATPARGSPAEIVDLANLLRLPGEARLNKADLFSIKTGATGTPEDLAALRTTTLRPGALETIAAAFRDRALYYRSTDPAHFPERRAEGAPLGDVLERTGAAPEPGGAAQPRVARLLRVTVVRASPEHTAAYVRVLSSVADDCGVKVGGHSPASQDGAAILDAAFPVPAAAGRLTWGLRSMDFARAAAAGPAWTRAHGVEYTQAGGVSGPAVKDPRLLAKYSAKLAAFRALMDRLLTTKPGEKIMVFHPRVKGMGVETVGEVLAGMGVAVLRTQTDIQNAEAVPGADGGADALHGMQWDGSVDGGAEVRRLCGGNRRACAKFSGAGSKCKCPPVRAIIVHSYLEAGGLQRRLEVFNRAANANGRLVAILVASEVLEEGHTVKCCRHQIALGLPGDLASYKQLRGRVDRHGSHADLPPAERDVTFHILITDFPLASPSREVARYGARGWDLDRWRRAAAEYDVTREVEKAVHGVAVGAGQLGAMHRLDETDPLEALPFAQPKRSAREDLERWTYYAYGYDRAAQTALTEVVRACFDARPVWTYKELLEAVRADPRPAPLAAFDPGTFSDRDVAAAVDALAWREGRAALGAGAAPVALRGGVIARVPGGPGKEPHYDYDALQRAAMAAGTWLSDDGPVKEAAASEAAPPVDLSHYARTAKRAYNFQIQRDEWLGEIAGSRATVIQVAAQFVRYSAEFHYSLLRELVMDASTAEKKLFRAARPLLLKTYGAFGFLVPASRARQYADRLKRMPPGEPVGFLTADSAVLAAKDHWMTVPRTAASTASDAREASTVGIFDARGTGGDTNARLEFKIRQGRAASATADRRTIERGMGCFSRKKEDLIALAKKLSVGLGGDQSVPNICGLVRDALLQREYDARRGTGARVRHFYMFNEPVPQ